MPSDPFADRVVAFSQGPPGWEDFSDPSAALGPPDMTADVPPGSFVCLGIGGQITLEFVNNVAVDGPGADIWVIGDIDNNDSLIVEVSADGVDFRSFGVTDERVELDLADVGLSYVRFVRISDDGSTGQGAQSAGAELDAVEALNSAAPEEIEPAPAVTLGQVDVRCGLSGPAGDPASRDPETILEIRVQSSEAVQIVVETPDGDTVALPSYGDLYGWEKRFHGRIQGLPRAGGTYTFIALDADGRPIPGAVASDVYVGGHEPDPPRNVQAEVVEAGILVTWDPSPVIPGAFDPSRPEHLGFYQMSLSGDEIGMVYGWNHGERLPETSHLIPLRRQDFGPDDRGMALEEMEEGIYFLRLDAFSVAPEGTAGQDLECESHDPAKDIQIAIEDGQVRIERP